MVNIYLGIVLAPLIGGLTAGLMGRWLGKTLSHGVTILGVATACVLSCWVFYQLVFQGAEPYNAPVYTWAVIGEVQLQVGFLVDNLTALMLIVVTFVSLMVHIYTIGYMHDDPGYQRFFSYISLFTFFMLTLVMANNFLQLFFGWEGVGLMSYLLIGFWFNKESAVFANLKAFLVNRVGDLGFVLGIAAVLQVFGSLQYADVFHAAANMGSEQPMITLWGDHAWPALTVICLLLFVGAMGKSAQVPLHVWLPDSMEGPTPISALIHAATMVTAGVFMVARMSPLFELSEVALSVVLVIGAITAFFMGLLGLVQNDIKRVVAYSTLSQLGYMMVAAGASAYAAAIFHLMTHAFFKALLFLAAGSVIIGMHHEQDIRRMGGLYKHMPITYVCALVGSLALIGTPLFSGFYSKDAIIAAVSHATIPGASFAYVCVLAGVFVTALYSFRMFFLVFHGKERMDAEHRAHVHESPAVVWLPLVLLAIPSLMVAWYFAGPMLFGDFFSDAIAVTERHDVLAHVAEEYHGPLSFALHGLLAPPFWLALLGVATAYVVYVKKPIIAERAQQYFRAIYTLLDNKYYFDRINQTVFAAGSVRLGRLFWRQGDVRVIDGALVNGSAHVVARTAAMIRKMQTGYLYHYALVMLLGVVVFFLIGMVA